MTTKTHNIVFKNERSELITKVDNNLGGWGFFKYLYSTAMFKILLFNFLMLVFLVPIVLVVLKSNGELVAVSQNLPFSSTFGLAIAPWLGLSPYLAASTQAISQNMYLWLLLAIPVVTVAFSGGFAVIRDAYWTGKLKIVKPFFAGVYHSALKFLPFMIILGAGVFGIYLANQALEANAIQMGLIVVLNVIMWAVLGLITVIGFVFLGASTLYKQSFGKLFSNSLKLTFKYAFSNIISFMFIMFPLLILVLISSSFVTTFMLTLFFMFGMVFMSLVWMIHLIRIAGRHAE